MREISLRNRPQSLYDISPKGTVPVLQLPNNRIIDESLDIMLWAIAENDKWIDNLDEQLNLINDNDINFKPWLDKYKYHDRHPNKERNFYQQECAIFLNKYNSMISSQSFLFGESLMLADAAIFPFIRQCAHVDYKWFSNEFPDLNQWLDDWKKSTLFLSIMNKYSEWIKGSDPTIIDFN